MAVGFTAALSWLTTPAADAHATVTATSPNNGQVIDDQDGPPDEVRVILDEVVTLSEATVIDDTGEHLETAEPTLDGSRTELTVPLPEDLPRGAYIVSWSLVSADSHPVGGSLQFGYGAPVGTTAEPEAPVPDTWLTVVTGVVKALVYMGLAVTFGVLPVILLLGGGRGELRAGRRAARAGAGIVAAASVVQVIGHHLWLASTEDGASWRGLWDLLGSMYGLSVGLRLVALGVAAVSATGLAAGTPTRALWVPRISGAAFAVSAVVACGSVVANGHGGAGAGWQFTSTLLHVLGATAWLGGLGTLGWLLLRHRLTGPQLRRLPRWSLYAGTCVVVVLVSGFLQAVGQVRFPGALLSTDYGVVLLVKLVLVGVVVAFGVRGFLRIRGGGGSAWRLVRGIRTEAVVASLVFAVSGVLSSVTPAKVDYAPTVTERVTAGPYELTVDAGPLRQGPASFRVTAVRPDAGRNDPLPQDVGITLAQGAGGVGDLPVDVPMRLPGAIGEAGSTPVTFVSSSVNVPSTGRWVATIEMTVDTFEQYVVAVPLDVV